jgi:hypothetical protein
MPETVCHCYSGLCMVVLVVPCLQSSVPAAKVLPVVGRLFERGSTSLIEKFPPSCTGYSLLWATLPPFINHKPGFQKTHGTRSHNRRSIGKRGKAQATKCTDRPYNNNDLTCMGEKTISGACMAFIATINGLATKNN